MNSSRRRKAVVSSGSGVVDNDCWLCLILRRAVQLANARDAAAAQLLQMKEDS